MHLSLNNAYGVRDAQNQMPQLSGRVEVVVGEIQL